jgi:amino acid transporter
VNSINPMMSSSGRRRSGLLGTISAGGAFLFGIHCISLSSSGFIPYSWVASVWPGASIIGVLTIAAVLCLFHACCYAFIGGVIPKAGADYVFASRVLSPRLAFASSWTLVLFSGIVAGGLTAWIPQSALPALLRPMAIIFRDDRYSLVADFVASPSGSFAIGFGIIAFVTVATLTSNRNIQRLLLFGFILGLLAWAIIYYSLASASGPQAFVDAWNRFMGPTGPYGAFDKRVSLALAADMHPSASVGSMTLGGLLMGFWIFYGYYIPTFFSEEVRNPTKNLFLSSFGALIVAWAIFMVGAKLLQRLVPDPTWVGAEGYLFNNRGAAEAAAGGQSIIAMPWITFYAAILKPVPLLIYLVAFGWIITLINLIQTYFFYGSRLVYSWALDRAVPDWLVGKNVREPQPRNAVLGMAALACLGLFDASRGGPLGTQMTFAFFAVVTSIVPILGLALLPLRHRELYMKLPSVGRRKFLRVPLVVWLAIVALAYLLWMVVASFLFPGAGIRSPFKTLGLLVVMLGSGVLVFEVMRRRRRTKNGIDILDTYKRPIAYLEEPEYD